MKVMVIEIDENSETMVDFRNNPAVGSQSFYNGVYFIKHNKIVGKGFINSRYNYNVSVRIDMDDSETVEFFKDDEPIRILKEHASFRFHEITGDYVGTYDDEDLDRGDELMIVDRVEFDYGYASKLRYGNVEGFGGKSV